MFSKTLFSLCTALAALNPALAVMELRTGDKISMTVPKRAGMDESIQIDLLPNENAGIRHNYNFDVVPLTFEVRHEKGAKKTVSIVQWSTASGRKLFRLRTEGRSARRAVRL